MGLLIDGKWSPDWYKADKNGQFIRPETQFRHTISSDKNAEFAPESDRYHLYVSLACPWAHRTLILRKLKNLESVISVSIVDPIMGDDGWQFSDGPGCIADSVYGVSYLRELYTKAKKDYSGRVTVPVLWDKKRHTIVNNESLEIMRILDTQFESFANNESFRPRALAASIDAMIEDNYDTINNGVYRAGFASSQQAYEKSVGILFSRLDECEQLLASNRYLCGQDITEADWCLFTTLVRFDMVYVGHFKCNLRRIIDYPNLWNYLKELYQVAGVADTCNFDHIKRHYYMSHHMINPNSIVPAGPLIDFNEAHNRGPKLAGV